MSDPDPEHHPGASDRPHQQLLLDIGQPDAPSAAMVVPGSQPTPSIAGTTRDCDATAAISVFDSNEARAGSCVVVAIGIDRYAAWPHLGNAVSDARGTAAVFRSLGFAEVSVLIDTAATGDAIRKLVTDDLGGLSVNDSLVVFFAGHGGTKTQVLEDGTTVKTGYIIPVDAENKQGQVSTWIRLDAWLTDIARLPPKHILVILDACHSGIALDSLPRSRDARVRQGDAEHQLSRRRSRKLIVSALDNEVALDGGPRPGHSLFTGHLIEALTGGLPRDGRREASGTELGLYLQTRVVKYPNSRQTPSFAPFELDDCGELMLPLFPAPGWGSLPLPTVDDDVNAALRVSLASTLAELVPGRTAIARLVSAQAPRVRVAELPAGTATTIWTCILVELTNTGGLSEISAIIDAVRQQSRRSRGVDWAAFAALLRPPAVPVVASWSHLELEIRRDTAQADGVDATLITSSDMLLEAVITLRWGGERPRDPLIEVTSRQLFGTTVRLLHETTQLPSPELATARWLVRIPVPRARVRTRAVTVRCAGTHAKERRYIVPHKGSLCATSLWFACAAFAAYWLSSILPTLIVLPLIVAPMALGLLPSVGFHLLSMLTGKRSFRRLLFVWEFAAPLTVLVATLVIALPPYLMAVVTNATKESLPLGDRGPIPGDATRPAWAWSVDTWNLARPVCWCGDSRSKCGDSRGRCSRPSPVHGVRRVALGCENGDCSRVTEQVGTAEIVRPIGTALTSSLLFGARATSSQMTLKMSDTSKVSDAAKVNDTVIEANKVVQTGDAALGLKMLPARTAYSLTFSDPGTASRQGTLDCKTGSTRIVRVELEPPTPRASDPPADHPAAIDITIGEARSTWTGAPEHARACADEAAGETATLTVKTIDGTLVCTGGPVKRVLVLEPSASAAKDVPPQAVAARSASAPESRPTLWMKIGDVESRWSPTTGSRITRACVGRPGDVEIAGLVPGDPVTLPKRLAFSHLRVRSAPGASGAVVTECRAGDTLRAVTIDANVKDSPTFKMQKVRVDRIGTATGVTCDEPALVRDDTRSCQLGPDRLSCTARYQGYRGDCLRETNLEIKPGARSDRCPSSISDVERDDVANQLKKLPYTCLEIYKCVR